MNAEIRKGQGVSEVFDKATEVWMYKKLFLGRVLVHSMVTLGLAWNISTQNIAFGSLDAWSKFGVVISVIVLWGDKMLAFVDQTMSRLAKGQLPVNGNGGGDTKPPFPVTPS